MIHFREMEERNFGETGSEKSGVYLTDVLRSAGRCRVTCVRIDVGGQNFESVACAWLYEVRLAGCG